MRKLNTLARWPDLVVMGAGGLSAALGLVVLVGWHTHNPALLQVLPVFVPMKYNTALGFFLSGVGLFSIALGRPRVALTCAAWPLLLGSLTLIEDVFSINIGIDELLMEDYLRVETSHPGRLAPNTALCFVLIGVAMLLMSNSAKIRWRPVVVAMLGSTIAALGGTAFFGYLSGLPAAYGWGYLTPMAVQTAGGCVMLGLGILAFAWGDARAEDRGLPRWLAIPVAIGVVTITLLFWQAVRAQEHAQIGHVIAAETSSVKYKIIEQMDTRVQALERIANRWKALGAPGKDRWTSDAWVLLIDYPGFQAVAWVDPSLRVRWIVPLAGNEAAQGLSLASEERRRTAMLQARHLRAVTFTRSIELAQGGRGFLAFVPIFRGETFGGFILGVFRAQTLLGALLGDEITPGYSIAVYDGEEEIYRRSDDGRQHQIGWGQETRITLPGVLWRVRVWPTPRLLATAQSSAPEATLVIGLVMASLLALTTFLAQRARLRRNEVEAVNRELQERITERAQAEEALRESEDRYRDLVEHSHELICTHDLAGQILSVNAEAVRCLGYDRRTLLKKNIRDILAPDVRDEFETYMRTIRRDGTAGGLMQVQTAAKERRILEYNNSLRTEGVATPVVRAISRDITERKEAERALRESEARYRDLVENANDIIYTHDLAGNLTSLNRAGEAISGYTQDEILKVNIAQVLPPEHLARVRALLTSPDGGKSTARLELEILTKDGRQVPLEIIARFICQNGQAVGVQGIARDITERKRAEAALQEGNRHLEEALAVLQTTQQQIIQQERLHALGTMASGIAHDFNNALNTVVGFSDLLLESPGVLENREKVTRYLRMINTAAQDAARVVLRLREFYRQRDATEPLEFVNLNEVVEETIALTQPKWKDQAQAAGLTIHVARDLQEVPLVEAVPAEVREVLTNLIFNAVEAMPRGGTITLRTRVEAGWAVLEVRDSGTGMPESVRQRCFEPFFTTKGDNGTGLGLAMVYGIIQRHGGTTEIESSPGQGTAIRIRLPNRSSPSRAGHVEEVKRVSKSLHVLIVDDEPRAQEVLTEYLSIDGHTSEAATHGREGLEKFRGGRFDLVMTDRAMPEMSGDQLCAAIRQVSPTTPTILVTGFGAFMKAAGEQPDGVDLILGKPVSQASLRAALVEAMSRPRLRELA